MHEEPPLKPDWLGAWKVESADRGLEDRVWRKFEEQQGKTRRLKGLTLAGAAAAAIAATVFLAQPAPSIESGALVAQGRSTWSIADGAVAVATDGSRLSWSYHQGKTEVRQESGDVFYRVDRGAAFEVITPAGSVRVLGTCFRVDLKGAAADREASALLTVYEGRVALSDDRSIGPGETALLRRVPPSSSATVLRAESSRQLEAAQEQIRSQADEIRRLKRELNALRTSRRQAGALASDDWTNEALDKRFEIEVRDESWATPTEEFLSRRMTKYMYVPAENFSVECRHSCCDVRLDLGSEAALPAVLNDFKSSIGIGIGHTEWTQIDVQGPSESRDGATHFYACSTKASGADQADAVDRGLEREQLLTRAASALELCRRSLTGVLEVEIRLTIDHNGAISHVQTTANPPGDPVTKCVEQAILSAARFAPAPRTTWFSVRLTLEAL